MTEIAVYNKFRSQLEALRESNSAAVFDYESKEGNKEARSHVYKLRQTKTAVDAARKKEKKESLEYGRRVDAEAKEIIGAIEEMIEIHAKPLDEIEQRDLDRIAAHRERIAEIKDLGSDVSNMDYTAEQLQNRRDALWNDYPINSSWEEFELEAARAKDEGITSLDAQIERRAKYEAEQAELAKLRAEQEAREKAQREEELKRQAAEQARVDAERAAQAERDRIEAEAKAERDAAERRELELKLQAEKAEREKQEAEQRARDAAAQAQRDLEAKAEQERREAAQREQDLEHRRKINCAAKEALTKGGLTEEMAELTISLIAKHQVPAISIAY